MESVKKFRVCGLLVLLMVISSCSVKRFLPKDEKLYSGATIKVINKNKIKQLSSLEEELQELLRPEPNSKILGSRVGLYYYYKSKEGSKNFITKYITKKIGEKPIYYSNVSQNKVVNLIKNRLDNRGFFNSKVTATAKENKYTKSIVYTVELTKPYVLESYQLENDTLAIYKEIKEELKTTLLKKGTRYNLESFKEERIKIDEKLKGKGYYNFNQDFIIFEADTNQYNNKRFDLYLRIKKETPKKALKPYKIDKVTVYSNYNLAQKNSALDSVTYKGVSFLQDTLFFKPKRLRNYLLFGEGDLYHPEESKITSKRLSSIGTYKYVNIQFDENKKKENDSIGSLNAAIYLSPLNKRSLGLELQAVTKSNNFAGPELSLNYRNRNLYNGGELLNITGTFAYETQIGNNTDNLNGIKLGLGASLTFPRLIFPWDLTGRFKYGVPKTKISFDSEYLSRSNLYGLASFTGSFGYQWDANKYLSHQINPVNINYVKLFNTTSDFETILTNNPFLQNSFDQQFIAGLTYNLTYNELGRSAKKNQVFFSTSLDVAGNALNLVSLNSGGNKNTFLGLEYAQYAKVDVDFRYYMDLGKEQTLVSRLYGGLGIPYGNSDVLPFTKQFFSGGPYSVRGFASRSIGPGTYSSGTSSSTYFDSSGDIRLEANLEYRFPIYSLLKGAFFADAGNVWLYNENTALGGGQFTSNFLNEMAVSAGAGLRVDIQSFVIRFDFATPVKQPTSTSLSTIKLSNTILNFAIGYPF
ncbi:translocation and assembly module lipoprotein TamL [Wenyingzhuangia aestuarii]|uniref:translocation and assembly module lipoprotein TamL n=1 Tax=Wenyingzhuangia aestuarii TaxID=1647582 RepID=UPI00143C3C12|nr:BamA/TamA family outer membrane protein [Wenyingzhuangia aestuarii]NJB81299.1 outer membrane protein assembly factor BamA [Wenyingzhuangia aestuarii]